MLQTRAARLGMFLFCASRRTLSHGVSQFTYVAEIGTGRSRKCSIDCSHFVTDGPSIVMCCKWYLGTNGGHFEYPI
jgi:hypothetical protein